MESTRNTHDHFQVTGDTPPHLCALLANALSAANSCIIPIIPDRYSFQGLSELENTIADVWKCFNKGLEIDGLLLVKCDPRRLLAKAAIESLPEICKKLDTKVFDTHIHEIEEVKKRRRADRACLPERLIAPRPRITKHLSMDI